MKIRHKQTNAIGHASSFNVASLFEIIVHYEDGGGSSEFVRDYDVLLKTGWKDMRQAFEDGDLTIGGYDIHFWEEENVS